MLPRLTSLLGLVVFLTLAWVFSNKRKSFPLRTVVGGLVLQFGFAIFILHSEFGQNLFTGARDTIQRLNDFSNQGADMAFGPLAHKETLTAAFGLKYPIVFAVSISATIILVSALSALLYHWGVLQRVVGGMAWVMRRAMGTSGSESLATASNIFLGQTEAALLVKPYIAKMTGSEIMALMTAGMATIATGVMVVYPDLGIDGGHILTASVLSAPASLLIAKLMYPETGRSETALGAPHKIKSADVNSLDALCRGTSEGVMLAINVMGMLVAFTAVVALLGACVLGIQTFFHVAPEHAISLDTIFGKLNAPFAWLMGVPAEHCTTVGQALGKRVVLNEFIGYLDLANHRPFDAVVYQGFQICSLVGGGCPHVIYQAVYLRPDVLDERSFTIATYALCGFANFASIAIQIGGIGAMAPERRHDLARIGLRAMFGGLLACYLTATVIGILI